MTTLTIKHNDFGLFNNKVAEGGSYSTPLFANIYPDSSNTLSFFTPSPYKINIASIDVVYWDGNFATKSVELSLPNNIENRALKIIFHINKTAPESKGAIYADLLNSKGQAKGTLVNPQNGHNELFFTTDQINRGWNQITFSTASIEGYEIGRVEAYLV